MSVSLQFVLQNDTEFPSIGELIDFLEAAQIAYETGSEEKTVAEILTEMFIKVPTRSY